MPKRTRKDPTAPKDVASLDVTVDATPLNHAHPSVTPVLGQANPQVSEKHQMGQGGGGANENEASEPTRGHTPPIHLDSPEREQQPRASDG
jgi:hypothetical protein